MSVKFDAFRLINILVNKQGDSLTIKKNIAP